MARNGVTKTGKSPDARECKRCGRAIGGQFFMGRFQPGRHRTPEGKPCRPPARAPETGEVQQP